MNNINNETGRSMIEMLGVLAIIGVLSVGGIAGYSKAMMQYKINKTVDQITQVVGNARTLYGSQKSYKGIQTIDVWKKSHLIPDEMWNTAKTAAENPFGGGFAVDPALKKNETNPDYKAFAIYLSGIPEDACMAIATYDWGSGSSSGLIAISVNDGTTGIITGYPIGCTGSSTTGKAVACPNGSSVSVPMPVNIAATACATGDSNVMLLKFY